jgi:hypothetical protein
MEKTYTRQDFDNLDLDWKCMVMEMLLTDDYFTGQHDINFHISINEETGNLNPTPPDIKKIEDEAFDKLLAKLTDKLFEDKNTIELDLEKMLE